MGASCGRGLARRGGLREARPLGKPLPNRPGPSESLDRPGRTFTAKPREKGARPRTHSGARGGAPAIGRAFVYRLAIDAGLSSSNHTTPGRARVDGTARRFGLHSAKRGGGPSDGSYLVDPASSHMLVSKIKPCMSKYNLYTGKLRMAH